jgi:hypothetical protein
MLAEAVVVTVLLGAILAAQLVASRSTSLLARNLSLDEVITEMLVVDPDARRSLGAIIGGLDTNPPAYHLLLRPWRRIIARRAEMSLRLFSLLSALIALVGVYLSLRQVYGALIAMAAVLAVWTHQLFQACAFEGRMYAPWVAAVVWFSYLLSHSSSVPADSWLYVLMSCAAVLTCMLHTLGPLSLVLVIGAHLVFNGFQPGDGEALMWASAGLILFVGWTPVLWKQSVANPVTWVPPATRRNVANFAGAVVMPTEMATLLLLGGGLAAFVRVPAAPALGQSVADVAPLAGLAGLVVMPLALIVLSFTVEPLLVDHYAVPAVVGFAPAIAAVIAPLPPFWLVLLSGALMTIGAYRLQSLRAKYGERDRVSAELIDAIHRHTGESPVFFETLHELMVLSRYTEPPARRFIALDFDDDAPGAAEAVRLSTKNQKRLISLHYASVTLIPWRAVRTLPELYLVPSGPSLDQGLVELERRYPEFAVCPLQGGLYRLVARRDRHLAGPGRPSFGNGGYCGISGSINDRNCDRNRAPLNWAARRRAASAICAHTRSSRASRRVYSVISLSVLQRKPLTPCSTISRCPPLSMTTGTHRAAIASTVAMPKCSRRSGCTSSSSPYPVACQKILARAYVVSRSVLGMFVITRTRYPTASA